MSTMPSPVGLQNTTDPRKIAQNQRQLIYQQGQQLNQQDLDAANAAQGTTGKTTDYLNQIEDPLAKGQGGYDSSETSQIQMTPAQQQQMVTSAGISAAAPEEAAVSAAQRASAAAGGNPMALAAYRARAARDVAGQASDAMTNARVAASNAAAQREENIGQTRLGQQEQALGDYQQRAQMTNQNAQNAYNRQQQTYGTETSGTNQAAQTGVQASQTPSTFDKIMGGLSGAVGPLISKLDEGDVMADYKTPAVVGENGPEKVVNLRRRHMADGDIGTGGLGEDQGVASASADSGGPPSPGNPAGSAPQPWWKKLATRQTPQQPQQQGGQQVSAATPGSSGWNPVDTYKTMGNAVGGLISKLPLADGGVATGGRTEYGYTMGPLTDTITERQRIRGPGGRDEPILGSRKTMSTNTRPISAAQFNDGSPRGGTAERMDPIQDTITEKSGYSRPARSINDDNFYADGGIATGGSPMTAFPSAQGRNGIFTQPTRVNLAKNEAVVPLSYRANAKTRPSMAAMPAAPITKPYRAAAVRRPTVPPIARI
jgi:hypothetical protein